MKGKKKYKNDQFAKCDGCGNRIYKEEERHYKGKYGCSSIFGYDVIIIDEAYCDICDKDGLKNKLIELDNKNGNSK